MRPTGFVKISILIFICLLSMNCVTQQETCSIPQSNEDSGDVVALLLDESDSKEYSIRTTALHVNENGTTSDNIDYDITLSVTDRSDQGYTLQCTYHPVNSNLDSNLTLEDAFSFSEGMKIIYQTDRVGNYIRLQNIDEVQGYYDRAFSEFFSSYRTNRRYSQALEAQIILAIRDKDCVERLATRDIRFLHSVYGISLFMTKPLRIERQNQNLLGSGSLPSILTITPGEYNAKENFFDVSVCSELDIEKGKQQIESTALELAKELAVEVGMFAPIDLLRMNEALDCRLEYLTAW